MVNKMKRKTIKGKKAWINKKMPSSLKFILICIVQIFSAFTSFYVLYKANLITNAANMLQINNAIQERTNAVITVEMKSKELEMWAKYNFVDNDDFLNNYNSRKELIEIEQNAAIYSLLNTYEFACIQYIEKKIDKEAFKLIYKEMLKHIKKEYSNYFVSNGLQENYKAINKVYKEWHGNSL